MATFDEYGLSAYHREKPSRRVVDADTGKPMTRRTAERIGQVIRVILLSWQIPSILLIMLMFVMILDQQRTINNYRSLFYNLVDLDHDLITANIQLVRCEITQLQTELNARTSR
jgi:hypothetical protein